MKRRFGSFAGRILLGGVIIHAFLIPFLFSSVLFIVERGYQQEFTDYVLDNAVQLKEHLAEINDVEHVRRHLEESLMNSRIVYADLMDASGKLIIPPTGPRAATRVFREDLRFGAHDDSVYFITAPLDIASAPQPFILRLGYDESPTERQIDLAYRRGVVLASAYVLLSLLLVAFVSPQLTRPLRRLRDAAQRIAAGQSGERLDISSGITEIADLAHDLEHMRQELMHQGSALGMREARLRAIMDNVVDGIITISHRGDIESLNPAAERIFGYAAPEVIGNNLNVLLAQSYSCDYDQVRTTDERRMRALAAHETGGRRKNGETFPMEMAISEMRTDEGMLFIAIVRDITQRKQAEAELKALQEDLERRVAKRTRELAQLNRELEHQALHDALTDLPNRVLLQDRLRQATLTGQRDGHHLALLLMDLDRFKEINDTLGHHYGDLLLREVAKRTRQALRESDTIARLGGDEFAVLLPVVEDTAAAVLAARKVIEAMERSVVLEEQNFHVGISVGIAMFPEHGLDGATLMRHADVAMYVAKRAGSGYAIYDPEQDKHSVSRLALVAQLRRAIEAKQLILFYQPKINLRKGRITGVEAVARWDHPERGLMLPDDFIPLAEHTGLIKPLTLLVLDEALHALHTWHQAGLDLTMAVNLSARHLHDQDLPQQVAELMAKWHIEPSWLELEITESAIMADPLRAMDVLTRLDAMGVGLSIDDFGTGYSSLIYLKQLPVDEIKIDKSFVIDMLDNNEDLVIVRSTIDLAHNMGRRVIAEGVENKEVLDTLIHLGCDLAQGYYLSRPLTAGVLQRWLIDSPWRVLSDAPESEESAMPDKRLSGGVGQNV